MFGSRCAMPLWQSMQVFSPVNRKRSCAVGRARVLLGQVHRLAEWQLRHSSESFAFMRAHSRSASACAASRNFSRVSIVPKILPHTSFDACILRAILSVQSCGTWQSGQVARTPERLVKWIVPFSSSKTLVVHLVAGGAELLGVGDFQRRVEAAPEDHAGDEAAERQEAEAERARRREGLADPIAQPRVAETRA